MSLSPFTRHFPFGRITSIANYRVCSLHSTVTLTKSISSMSSVSPQRSSQLLFPPPPRTNLPAPRRPPVLLPSLVPASNSTFPDALEHPSCSFPYYLFPLMTYLATLLPRNICCNPSLFLTTYIIRLSSLLPPARSLRNGLLSFLLPYLSRPAYSTLYFPARPRRP